MSARFSKRAYVVLIVMCVGSLSLAVGVDALGALDKLPAVQGILVNVLSLPVGLLVGAVTIDALSERDARARALEALRQRSLTLVIQVVRLVRNIESLYLGSPDDRPYLDAGNALSAATNESERIEAKLRNLYLSVLISTTHPEESLTQWRHRHRFLPPDIKLEFVAHGEQLADGLDRLVTDLLALPKAAGNLHMPQLFPEQLIGYRAILLEYRDILSRTQSMQHADEVTAQKDVAAMRPDRDQAAGELNCVSRLVTIAQFAEQVDAAVEYATQLTANGVPHGKAHGRGLFRR